MTTGGFRNMPDHTSTVAVGSKNNLVMIFGLYQPTWSLKSAPDEIQWQSAIFLLKVLLFTVKIVTIWSNANKSIDGSASTKSSHFKTEEVK